MSNAGQAFTTAVGAVVGYYIGGPTGAAYGAQIGMLAGSLIFPTQLPTVYGPRLQDLQTTNAELGVPIPIIYGTIAVPGIAMYVGCSSEVSTTTEIGGKGGSEQSQTTYTYFQTLAVALCEGPIDGLLRVWENGELKYDARVQQVNETDDAYAARLELSSEYEATFSLYLGDELQEADPTIETELGYGNVPAFRGLAYIVFPDRQLTDEQARRHPAFRFEVYQAVSVGRDVVQHTSITGFSSWQANRLAVDWSRNRYYTIDNTGAPAGQGIRVYNIFDNTELEQKTFADIIGDTPSLVYGFNVGLDGFIYLSYYSALNTHTVYRIDPGTLEPVAQASLSGTDAYDVTVLNSCFLRQYGTSSRTDYWLCGAMFGAVTLFRCDSLGYTGADSGLTYSIVCPGARVGVVSYGWAIAYTGATVGTGVDLQVWRVRLFETFDIAALIWVPDSEIELIATIAPSDVVPTWTRFVLVSGLVFDDTDDTLIFGAKGGPAAIGATDVLLKWNPDTQTIVWQTAEDEVQIVNVNFTHGSSRLRGGEYPLIYGIDDFKFVDTGTGTVRTESWTGDLPQTLLGESQYHSGFDAMITFFNGSLGPVVIFFDRRVAGNVSLAEIVSDVWDRCAGDPVDIDVTDLETRYVEGYALARPMPGRGAIDMLRPLGPFDGVESEGILKFPVRGKPIVATLTVNEVGVFEDAAKPGAAVTCREVQDVELPQRVRLKYIAPSRDYEPGEQFSPTRFTSSTVHERDVELAVAITDTQGAQTSELLWAEAWASRWQYETSVDVEFLDLDPADCIGLPFNGRIYRARIVSIDDSSGGLIRKLQLVRDDDGIYVSEQVADVPSRQTTSITDYSLSGLVLLDLPPLRDEDDDPGIYAALYRLESYKPWNGAIVYRSSDAGATYAGLVTGVVEATVGVLGEDLAAGITTTWDMANEIVVDLYSGTFESRTDDDLLSNRLNALAIGSHGRWEVVQFTTATQESATRWRLTRLLRGRRATEHNTGTGLAGDKVVLLSGVLRLPLQIADIGVSKVYKPVTLGMTLASAAAQSFAGNGEALECFSPVSIEAERDGSENITLTWIRRGRIGYELPDGADIPLSEETESYSVDVVDTASPETVLRTIAAATQTAAYTAAQQTADGLTPGDPVTFDVYQISATVGRGHAGRATV